MGIEWVAPLKRDIEVFHRDVIAFIDQIDPNEKAQHDFTRRQLVNSSEMAEEPFTRRRLHEDICRVNGWARALPLDEATWEWLPWADACLPGYQLLEVIMGHLSMLLIFSRRLNLSHMITTTILPDFLRRVDAIHDDMRPYFEIQSKTDRFISLPLEFYVVPPSLVLTVARLASSHWIDCCYQPISNQNDRPVLYQPSYTINLLRDMMRLLSLTARVMVGLDVSASPLFFELRLTARSIHMRPEIWESILVLDSVEVLREMGGNIEPLTWDTGRGQGVIVHLPWAKTAEERDNGA